MVPVTALIVWLFVALMPMTLQAGSARIELAMAPDLVAEADYWPGAADMPAILILHGFLQTREFPTVRRLAQSLADEGFSVLTPSLTLGLDRRRQSLDCEAIHTHTLEQDVSELSAWIRWLASRAGKAPVVIGHSTGGVQLAAVMDSDAAGTVTRALFISLVAFETLYGGEQVPALRVRAQAALDIGPGDLHAFPLGYCRNYVTTATAYLSYLDWDRQRLTDALSTSPVPATVIVGDEDERLDQAWLDAMQGRNLRVHTIPGADHFFDLAHEFDLLDEVVRLISETENG